MREVKRMAMNNDNITHNEDIVTLKVLATAIRNGIRSTPKVGEEEAIQLANHVLNFFGFDDRIIDNYLEPDDRGLFYMMEEIGILIPEREEITLYDGREWRIHYWNMNINKIYELQKEVVLEEHQDESYDIYKEIPDEIWNRGEE
ncbi:MAG: DUF6015 family protein [Thermoplasmata archaeon]